MGRPSFFFNMERLIDRLPTMPGRLRTEAHHGPLLLDRLPDVGAPRSAA
jgi:hypothetical protein